MSNHELFLEMQKLMDNNPDMNIIDLIRMTVDYRFPTRRNYFYEHLRECPTYYENKHNLTNTDILDAIKKYNKRSSI